MDFSVLRTLGLGQACFKQLMSMMSATDLLVPKIEAVHQDAEADKLVLPGFTLDVTILPESSLLSLQKVMSFFTIKNLFVNAILSIPDCLTPSLKYLALCSGLRLSDYTSLATTLENGFGS